MPDNKLHGKQIKDKSINLEKQGFVLDDYTFVDINNAPVFVLSNKTVSDYASASNAVLVNKEYLSDRVTYLEDLIYTGTAGNEMYVNDTPNQTSNVSNLIIGSISIPNYKEGTSVEIELNGLTLLHKKTSGARPTNITEGECYFSNDNGATAVAPANYIFDSNTTALYLAYDAYDNTGKPIVGFEIEPDDVITIFYNKKL